MLIGVLGVDVGHAVGEPVGITAAVAMALGFEIPLTEWLSSSAAGYTISLIAGVLVGAFFGLYTAKRIVQRLAHR